MTPSVPSIPMALAQPRSDSMPVIGLEMAAVTVNAPITRPTSPVLMPIEVRCTGKVGRKK